jgi:hypothetical protein
MPLVTQYLSALPIPVAYDSTKHALMRPSPDIAYLDGSANSRSPTYRELSPWRDTHSWHPNQHTKEVWISVILKDLLPREEKAAAKGKKHPKLGSDSLTIKMYFGAHRFNHEWYLHSQGTTAVSKLLATNSVDFPVTYEDILLFANDCLSASPFHHAQFDVTRHILLFATPVLKEATSDEHPKMLPLLSEVLPEFVLRSTHFNMKTLEIVIAPLSTPEAPINQHGGSNILDENTSTGVSKWVYTMLTKFRTRNDDF